VLRGSARSSLNRCEPAERRSGQRVPSMDRILRRLNRSPACPQQHRPKLRQLARLPVSFERGHDRRDLVAAAKLADVFQLLELVTGMLRQRLLSANSQTLPALARVRVESRQAQLPTPRRARYRRTWAATARVSCFRPRQQYLPASCGASCARSSIYAYSACSTRVRCAAICSPWQAGYLLHFPRLAVLGPAVFGLAIYNSCRSNSLYESNEFI
jgi:hypothetical protein